MSFQETILRERAQPSALPTAERQTSIFIVDDEPMVGEVVGMVLGTEGFKTRVFISPEDALDALNSASEKPEILITDFAMAGLNGVELIERFKQIAPEIRTVLYSGAISDEEADSLRGAAHAFLSKPFLPKELIATVRSVVPK